MALGIVPVIVYGGEDEKENFGDFTGSVNAVCIRMYKGKISALRER